MKNHEKFDASSDIFLLGVPTPVTVDRPYPKQIKPEVCTRKGAPPGHIKVCSGARVAIRCHQT